jgi:hypothetical protein
MNLGSAGLTACATGAVRLEEVEVSHRHGPRPDGKGRQANLIGQPELAAALRPGPPRHGDPLRGVIAGVTTRAQDGQETPVCRVMIQVGDVQKAVRLLAPLAYIASAFEHGQTELAPARIVVFAIVHANRHASHF